MSITEKFERLNKLRQNGAISEEEYEEAKASILAGEPNGISSDVNMWGMFIHLSQFCGYIVPLAGLIVPIVLWQMKKNEAGIIDIHGRIVINWIITQIILGVIFGLLCFVLIGIPLIFALGVVSIVFPIVGGVKANGGETWKYPFSIEFFKLGFYH